MIDEKDILINDISKKDKEFLESYDLKIVSINETISEDNKNEWLYHWRIQTPLFTWWCWYY
ncbi:hypothetical protein [Spiroplasma endosymbiont of Seladonia tumulorum]|uniref:hypothetical protein n=1 Tax=Spiroplasma endosymbiont of Seladonia tumulorum TaxID=3066321 RepID=UPI0030D19860